MAQGDTVWQFERELARRLLAWSALSGVLGTALLAMKRPARRGFGLQCIGWGLACAGIAWGARVRADRLEARDRFRAVDMEPSAHQELTTLPFVLFLSGLIDTLYLLVGVLLARAERGSDLWGGQGWGIAAQGAFLTAFDLGHALASSRVIGEDGSAPER